MVRVMVVAILLILPGFASAASCGVIDTTYVIYTGEKLKVDRGVSINGSSVTDDDFGADSGLNTDGSIETGSVNIPVLDPPSFPNNPSSVKLDEGDSPIDGSSEIFLEKVDVAKNSSLTFTGEGPFHIEKLKVDQGSSVNFSAGTYFIDKIDIKENVILNFEDQVRLHIGDEFKIDQGVGLNNGSNPSRLLIFLHENAKFESDKNTVISSVIVGVNNDKVKLEQGVSFTGAILTDGKVELKKNMQLNLSPAQQIEIGSETTCEEEVTASSVDHFVVSHDNNGINCVSEVITITAVNTLGDPVIDYVAEVTLSTQSGFGSFSLVSGSGVFDDGAANDGVATYFFDLSDDGSITVSLSYPEGPSTLDIDVFQSDTTGLRDDDSEAALVFSPSGFTVTGSVLSNPPPSVINDPIDNQIAGSNFAVHITAYGQSPTDPVCGVIEAYDGNQSLAFWMDYANPSSGSIVATVNGSAISSSEAGATPQTVNFSSGRASVSTKYKDVGQIQIEMKDNDIRGATTPFILKPADIKVTAVTDASGGVNPAASSVTGSAFVNAGELFRVTVEVQDAEGDRTPNFGNEASVEGITLISQNLVVPLGGVNGSADDGALSNAAAFTAIAPAGTWRNTSLSWNEVGVIQLQASIADGSYLGTGDVLGTTSGNVGRFTPASFTLASSSVTGACGNSTYMGQAALGVSYQLEARGEGGNPLRNYDETLLGAGNVATLILVAENNDSGSNLASRISMSGSNWLSGVRSLNTSIGAFSRGTNPDGPYGNLQLGVQISDPVDGLSIASPDMNAATIGDCAVSVTCNARAMSGVTEVIYGRLEVLNAFGPETETLNVGLLLSSYAASGEFLVNSADSCSTYIQSAASLGNYQDGLPAVSLLAPGTATNFVNGASVINGGLLLSSPGAMNTGSVDVTYDAPSWLEYDWAGSGATDPLGTAIFGQYRGHDKVIYWREVY
jgi:MSHA biogenesis protein MshQ